MGAQAKASVVGMVAQVFGGPVQVVDLNKLEVTIRAMQDAADGRGASWWRRWPRRPGAP
jgi:hypothetical protein